MIKVVGGTYREIDYDDISIEIYGSGFRAAKFLLENNCSVNFSTVGNNDTISYLKENQKVYNNFSFECKEYQEIITFKYSFSLDYPTIFPHILNITKVKKLNIRSENIITFGMLEADFTLSGDKVVYDPQTPIKPRKFSEFGKAKELIYIVNKNEASSIASSEDIEQIKNYFFNLEQAKAFIIKDGPFGAILYLKTKEIKIPSYITNNVNKIGSGDIFTSSFGFYWLEKGLSLEESAIYASRSTAIYCDKKVYVDTSILESFEYREFSNKTLSEKQVYLASPFFSISELILIDKIRSAFLSFGIKVFSPFHDIGLGDEVSIAKKDLEGIEKSDMIFCVLDNFDSGTLIESGYSLAKGKKIIGYHRTCSDSDLLMLRPANILFYQHLTTAIYQTIWNL
ncbi:MAG: PfkB family carbohydrate kinase [Flavobacterium nitrogenifigens]|uniref:PfkB family carbohydrate kinase n=1 Tax=Flavobacterium nitrogenifigens TaxID=1617283 RepID=UPI002808D763|nr:PfkB family carbohydrate kinase [Flavobacterium nitrogenifigens]MDQ8014952.1 PfkB family carbohydrate kinase [Flavobacterium nitrogenifigens]